SSTDCSVVPLLLGERSCILDFLLHRLAEIVQFLLRGFLVGANPVLANGDANVGPIPLALSCEIKPTAPVTERGDCYCDQNERAKQTAHDRSSIAGVYPIIRRGGPQIFLSARNRLPCCLPDSSDEYGRKQANLAACFGEAY